MVDSHIIWLEVLVLPLGLASVGKARDFASANLESHDLTYLVDPIRLVVSELVTNALVHALPPVIVSMQERGLSVLITVSDKSSLLPVALPHEETALGGRGLAIVDELSRKWGSNARLDGGKSVWASFDKKTNGTTPGTNPAYPS